MPRQIPVVEHRVKIMMKSSSCRLRELCVKMFVRIHPSPKLKIVSGKDLLLVVKNISAHSAFHSRLAWDELETIWC